MSSTPNPSGNEGRPAAENEIEQAKEKWIVQSTQQGDDEMLMPKPTEETYQEFQDAYSFFNSRLFQNELPDCLITMQRQSRSLGYFCRKRFVHRNGTQTDEIALNPRYFAARSERGVLSTLCHEQMHLFQYHFGHSGKRGYHNREWANKMISLGLYPSNTGKPGGRELGYQMSHYIIEGGPFDVVCSDLLATGFQLSWLDNTRVFSSLIPPTTTALKGYTDSSNRWKYTCPACDFNVWGRPEGKVICGFCKVHMPHNTDRG